MHAGWCPYLRQRLQLRACWRPRHGPRRCGPGIRTGLCPCFSGVASPPGHAVLRGPARGALTHHLPGLAEGTRAFLEVPLKTVPSGQRAPSMVWLLVLQGREMLTWPSPSGDCSTVSGPARPRAQGLPAPPEAAALLLAAPVQCRVD